jgi:RecA-family ATPase
MAWMNFDIPKVQRVAYSSVEMSHSEIAWFLREMRKALDVSSLQFRVFPVGQTVSILTEDGKNYYRAIAEDFDVIVIDTLNASTHTTLSDEEAARHVVDFFAELSAAGKTIIVVHHDSKSTGTHQRTEDAYGSRLFVDRASTVLRLSKIPNNTEQITLNFSKIRLAKEPDPMVLERTENLWYVSTDGVPIMRTMNVKGLPGGKSKGDGKPRVEPGLY